MSDRSSALLDLYQALIDQVKRQYEEDNSLTAKSLFVSVIKGREFLKLKSAASDQELELVEEFLKRDIASYIKQSHAEDILHSPSVIAFEKTLWHWLGELSDRSQVQWHEITSDFEHQGVYRSGEVINQGKVVCNQCQHEMDIEFPSIIPDCPECDSTEFSREALMP
ncbi:zinc ribbon-containing protein [Shewanella sp. WXL01]|uniref:zinc ribbon-containing protein n=1 Tax=Shewanella sp. WXL01 TaxID=2709721 RepID=UPI0014383697|nr:zinc ribbon-containing protein [Shewanella sp. WXL01]NKF49576.1 zinc ribbon-containing protein [Shewanella sp. WXL01]